MIIRARNFLSWENLVFKVTKGVTLIQGFNHDDGTPEGSGKSAILNALCWGLYGAIPKDANIDDVIREGAKTCEVSIEVPGEFIVVRTRKPNDLSIVYPSGKVHRGKDARETQKDIERLVGMTFETFLQVIYYAQNYPNKFVTANQENKGKILSEILDLEQFDRARKVAADRAKKAQLTLAEATKDVERFDSLLDVLQQNQSNFQGLIERFHAEKKTKIQNLFKQIQQVEADAEQFVERFEEEKAADLKTKKRELKELDAERAEAESSISELESALNSYEAASIEAQKERLTEALEHAEEKRSDLRVKLGSIEGILEAHNKQVRELKKSEAEMTQILEKIKTKKADLKTAKADLKEAIEKLSQAIEAMDNPSKENCPTCGQSWDGDPAHYEKEVAKAKLEERKAEKAVTGLQRDLDELEDQRVSLDTNIGFLKSEIEMFEAPTTEKLEKQIEAVTSDIEGGKAQMRELDSALKTLQRSMVELEAAQKRLESLQRQVDRLNSDLEKIKDRSPARDLEGFQRRMTALETELDAEDKKEPETLLEKLKEAEKGLKKVTAEREHAAQVKAERELELARLEALRDGYKEVKAYTFQRTLNLLSKKANGYLSELFEQPVKIKFENVDMKIDVSVTIDGRERPIALYSGGQFRRIALAVDLALSDITLARKNNKLNVIIMDEYCKDLSEVSMEKVLKLLQSRKGATVLIEHNSIFKSIVNNTFEVELVDGVSREVA